MSADERLKEHWWGVSKLHDDGKLSKHSLEDGDGSIRVVVMRRPRRRESKLSEGVWESFEERDLDDLLHGENGHSKKKNAKKKRKAS